MSFDTLKNNRILNGTVDLHSSRDDIIRELQEAVDYQRSRTADVFVYRFGFLRLPFVDSRLENGFNLHVWLDDLPRDRFPHTHIFDLESRVLKERITDIAWQILDDEKGDCIRVQPQYHDGRTTDCELPGHVRIQEITRRTLNQDDVYTISRGEYHSSEIPKGANPTVTLVRKSKIDTRGHPINIIPVTKPKEQFFDLQSFGKEQAWKILTKIVDKL